MASFSVILQLASFACSMPTANLVNITILAPEGTSNHSDPHIFCAPTKARDVALFFFESYLAHSATVRTLPGEPFFPSLLTIIFALLFPATGTARGLRAILQGGASFMRDPVRAAIRARAVCEVVRGRYWRPKDGDVVRNLKITRKGPVRLDTPLEEIIVAIHDPSVPLFEDTGIFLPASSWTSTSGRSVHGSCIIPPGYALAIVPSDVQFERDDGDPEAGEDKERKRSSQKIRAVCTGAVMSCCNCLRDVVRILAQVGMKANPLLPRERRQEAINRWFPPRDISGAAEIVSSDVASSFGFSKGVLGVLQLVWASYTLARTRGDQLERYGYAAFGLTVIPYLLMTFINLLSLVLTPSYSHVYLASSQIMEEAKSTRQGQFKGEIGRLKDGPVVDDTEKRKGKLVDVQFEKIGDQFYLTPLREGEKPGNDQTYELNRSILEESLGAATGGRYKVKWNQHRRGLPISLPILL